MRYRVTNELTGEVFLTDSLREAYRVYCHWIRETERYNILPWYIADVNIYDFEKKIS